MSASALIFDVKHYAVHDGPGIRTTFFLMGCPLRCKWCQNPESFRAKPRISFMTMKCIGCGECVRVCGKLDQTLRLPRAECTLCGQCAAACHSGAKVFTGRRYTPQEVLDIALQEKVFYEASGGGVTFSGGECLSQPDFMEETLRLCHGNGIHVTVDTCGAVPWQTFERVMPYAGLYLYDVKVIDSGRHKAYTGMDNKQILENLGKLCAAGAQVIIRVPLIPGYTDAPEDIAAIGRFVRDQLQGKIIRVELLPYNKLAASKYGSTTIWTDGGPGEYPLPDLEPQDKPYIASLAGILSDMGVPVYAESL